MIFGSRRSRMQRRIGEALAGAMAGRHREELFEHLRSDDASRAEYDRAVGALRILADEAVAPVELELVEGWLFDAPVVAAAPWWRRSPALALAAAAAAALLVVVLPPRDDGWGVKWPFGRKDPGLALTVLCGGPQAQLRSSEDGPCDVKQTLAFGYRVDPRHGRAGYLSLFGVDHEGDVMYYAPTPADDDVFAVVPTRDRQPLGLSIDLDINHVPGSLRVFALVAPRVLTVADVDAAAAQLAAQTSPAEQKPWHQRLGGGRITTMCARDDVCFSAEVELTLYQERP